MALSINDFRSATAYPCGSNKQACYSMLKEVPELLNVKHFSVLDVLKKGKNSSTKPSSKTR